MEEKTEQKQEKQKPKNKIVLWILLVFVGGFIIGQLYNENIGVVKETSFINAIKNLEKKDQSLDYNLFGDVLELIRSQYYKQPVSEKNLFYGSLEGLVAGLKDPYSVFMEPGVAQKFKTDLSGTFEGIGAEISFKNDQIVIVAPLDGTPAFQAGLKAGDVIIQINGELTANMTLDGAVDKIRGPRGTTVKLMIMRKGWDKPKEFSIIRNVIIVKTVNYKVQDGGIIYLKITYFNDKTVNEFDQAIRKILTLSPKGIILDLRNDPGGYLDAAVDIGGDWVGNKTMVYERSKDGQDKEHHANRQAKLAGIPLIVLINGGSASGSEILAGALQDYGVGKLLGEKTFGKGTVQEVVEMNDGSIVKITIAQWLTPKKRIIEEKGIEPDIKVELTDQDAQANKDPQLDKAMQLLVH